MHLVGERGTQHTSGSATTHGAPRLPKRCANIALRVAPATAAAAAASTAAVTATTISTATAAATTRGIASTTARTAAPVALAPAAHRLLQLLLDLLLPALLLAPLPLLALLRLPRVTRGGPLLLPRQMCLLPRLALLLVRRSVESRLPFRY